jgi:hypothetical protein
LSSTSEHISSSRIVNAKLLVCVTNFSPKKPTDGNLANQMDITGKSAMKIAEGK